MNSMVRLTNASLDIKKNTILEDVTLQLETDRIYGLLGRNGAGKTSLLSLIASYRKPTGGTVCIDGRNPYEDEVIMAQLSFVYEADYSENYHTPEYMCRVSTRYRPEFDSDYALSLMEGFGIDSNQSLNRMSKGQQAAVNAIFGLASNAPITIFDEVTNGMDAPTREYFYKMVLEANKRHPRMIIFSTHIVSEMEHLFDEVIIIDDGQVMLQEPVDLFLERGFRVSGTKEKVAHFTAGMDLHAEETVGPLHSRMVLGSLGEEERKAAKAQHLYIEPLKVQELFIRLTETKEG